MFSSKQQEANPPSYNSSSSSEPVPGSSEYLYKQFLNKRKEEIGEQLGLTRERVRQIETEALNRLADGLKDPREIGYIFRR